MNITSFPISRAMVMTLLFTMLFTAVYLLTSNPAAAAPQMRDYATGLEGTQVLAAHVNKKGIGRITLRCGHCPGGRIRLDVTPESYVTVNGEKVPVDQYRAGSRDFISGFYVTDTRELIKLTVTR